MEGNIKSYLQAVAPDLPLEIVSQELYGKLNKLTDFFKDFAASEYILETSLNSNSAEADFSFRVLTEEKDSLLKGLKNKDFMNLTKDESWRRFVDFVNYWPQEIADLWLEMDYGEWEKEIPRPCFFFNAGQLKKNGEIDYNLLFTALKQLLGCEQVEELKENIKDVIQKLPAEVNLFQIGTMLSRNKDRVRIFTAELTREQVVEYLADLGWSGSFSDLDEILHFLEEFSDHQYILDFDVSRQGISERIGLNFGLQDKKMLSVFLESLASRQLCTEAKKQGVLAWSGSKGSFLGPNYGFTALIKNISHFKLVYVPKERFKVKVYLRIAGIYLKELFKAKNKRVQTAEQKADGERTGYKKMQNAFKKIVQKAMLDKDYRQLCLRDSRAAIKEVIDNPAIIPDNIIFLEEDSENVEVNGCFAYVLPPFLPKTWLSK